MTEKDAEAAETLWMDLVKERAQLDAECTEDEVEQEAAWCYEARSSVLDATAKKIRLCARSKRWWNVDIKAKKKDSRRREKEKPELEGGCPGEGKSPEVDPAVEETKVR